MRLLFLGYTIIFLTLSACGGGGGGSSNGGTPSGASGISYTGIETAAQIDETNAAEIVSTVITGSDSGSAVSVVGVETSTSPPYFQPTQVIASYLSDIDPFILGQNILGVEVSETESCLQGGSLSYEGDVNENNGDFSLEFEFNDCQESGVTLNGVLDASGSLSLITEEFDAPFLTSFENLEYNDGSLAVTMDGTVECTFDQYPDENGETVFQLGSYWCNQNLFYEDGVIGDVFWLRDLAIVNIPGLGSDSVYLLASFGRFYLPQYGYVEISGGTDAVNSATVTIYNDLISIYPVAGGGVFEGDSSSVRLTFNNDGLTYQLDLDADGDEVFESMTTENW